jgi:predicted dehydrogenase
MYEAIQVGTGGQGEAWCTEFLPPYLEARRVDVVAAVDVDPEQHATAIEGLGVPPSECYTDAAAAFENHPEADFCTVVVPPWHHEEIAELAAEHGLHVLSEKPIAEDLEAAVRVVDRIAQADLKMGVTMSHRFDRDKVGLRRAIRDDASGPLDYLVGRFTCNARADGSWGAFRHEMDDVLLIEGAVHQLDFLADMAGAPCATLYADTWNPEWAEYEGDVQALVQLRFENGVRASWEGAKANATTLNGWGNDYVRAECRDATLVLDGRELRRHPYVPGTESVGGSTPESAGDLVPLPDDGPWMNERLVGQFLHWLDGGPPMATRVAENLQSMALITAAIESSRTGEPVHVQERLAAAEAAVRGE